MIPQPFIHDLLNRVDIINTIDRHVPLKKTGANFVACCPFHSEKTPSFTVSQSKQFYHCFGCGAHGNAISFLVEYSGLSFVEAVRNLADYVGMQVPTQQTGTSSNSIAPDDLENYYTTGHSYSTISHQDLLNVIQVAACFYREQLKSSGKAIAYLKKRGLSGKIAAQFAIGYAPAGWQNLGAVFSDYKSEKSRNLLIQAGLVIVNGDAKQYDRFRNRIMFPILNQKGQITGFGGRVLDNEEPKYLNTPETILFEKGRELYNFFSARRAIREVNCALVVEGYMDVISLAQHGINYAVASLGTAITGFHLQKLLRQTDQIIFCFDGDKAGRKAAWRALENSLALLTDGKSLSFFFLPDGTDPDSYVRKNGKELFEQQLKQAVPLSEFLFKELCSKINTQTSEGRAKLIHDVKPLLKQVVAPALSLILLKRVTELCDISQPELEKLLQIKPFYKKYTARKIPRKQPITPCRWLIMILLHSPSYINRIDKNLFLGEKKDSEEIAALEVLIELFDKYPHLINNETPTSAITACLQSSSHRTLFETIESEILEWNDTLDLEAEFSGALEKLQQVQRKKRITELYSKSLNALTDDEKRELQQLAMR